MQKLNIRNFKLKNSFQNIFFKTKAGYKDSFFKTPSKNFFISYKRPARAFDDFEGTKANFEDLEYFKQMKEFINETKGLPKNSQKWVEIRNKHFKILEEKKRNNRHKFIETFDVQYLRFYLIILPEQTDCYELVNILNFYSIKFKALEDSPVSKAILRQMLGLFSKVDHSKIGFPFLLMESSEEPNQTFEGFDSIVQFLIENNFIHDYRSHSVYEKDGVNFIRQFEDFYQEEMKKLSNKFSFYFRPTNFKEARYWYHPQKDLHIYRNRIFSRIHRIFRSIAHDFMPSESGQSNFNTFINPFTFIFKLTKSSLIKSYKFIINFKGSLKDRKEKNKVRQLKLIELISTFVTRINNNSFHGGDVPDAADFKLYAIMRKYRNCRKNNLILKSLFNGTNENIQDSKTQTDITKFDDWIARMYILCNRNNYYNIRDVGYNYNRYMSEEVNEIERINKAKTKQEDEEPVKTDKNISRKSIMGVFGNRTKRNKVNI